MRCTVAIIAASTLVFPTALSAQGTLRDSIAREATRAALSAGGAVQATEPPQEWDAVVALYQEFVKVTSRDGRAVIGRFVSADAGSITIDRRWSGRETFSRDDVREVHLGPAHSTAGSLALGAVAGLALGAVSGWGACSFECSDKAKQIGLVVGGGLGLAWGAIAGFNAGAVANAEAELVYRAPASR